MSSTTSTASSPQPSVIMDSASASTAPSSPPSFDIDVDDEEHPPNSQKQKPIEEEDSEERYTRLTFLLDKSALYAQMLKTQMDAAKAAKSRQSPNPQPPPSKAQNLSTKPKPKYKGKGKKRALPFSPSSEDGDETANTKRVKLSDNSHPIPVIDTTDNAPHFTQPALITGATLKPYQLEGVEWMISLDQNGISGILADEMGLGKTLQTIAFNAYLRERGFFRPFLVVCPLSVLYNWGEEYRRFAPGIPVCTYHGTPVERAELRKSVMRWVEEDGEVVGGARGRKAGKEKRKGKGSKVKVNRRKNMKAKQGGEMNGGVAVRRSTRVSKPVVKHGIEDEGEDDDEGDGGVEDDDGDEYRDDDEEDEEMGDVQDDSDADETESRDSTENQDGTDSKDKSNPQAAFPVILTTYEILMRDRQFLEKYKWGYIVVDEGHRLKNFDCRLMREIKRLRSGGRLVLSGTPLHNNLAELWSLLNFILPDIFHDLDSFQEWFNLPTLSNTLSSSRSSRLIHSLHAILKPFLLRRTKADLDLGLPPKKEYVLYAPLSGRQKGLYEVVVRGGLRGYLIGKSKEEEEFCERADVDVKGGREVRKVRKRVGNLDGDDDEYFERLESGVEDTERRAEKEKAAKEIGREWQHKATLKQVNNMKLQNAVMQLRKVCSHPFLFDWPVDPNTREPVINEELVNASGKMMVLDRLLGELFRRKHKVLLFSQFTTMLDIIEDWATEFKGWAICRIDGSSSPMERREQMDRFQYGADKLDAPRLFLLSTRAGGLGINLVAADTVIFYDQDWNPQMDIQAQDRAHRIGQTKPVLIFRLVSQYTIEEKIMQRASEKRKLEALVIAKDKFNMPASVEGHGKPATMAEMATSLLKLEGEKIEVVSDTDCVISDRDLEVLLDRRPEVFADRGKGWTSGSDNLNEKVEKRKKAAFAVYVGQLDEGNDALARVMGEEMEC